MRVEHLAEGVTLYIGIEREPKYFDIACRRISGALARPDLFITRQRRR